MEQNKDLQSYVSKIEARIARLETRDIDLHGRRVRNASDAQELQDYATLSQLNQTFQKIKFPSSPPFPSPIYSFAYNSAAQSIPTGGGGAVLTFDTNIFDVGGIHSTTVNPTQFTCIDPGTYIAFCQVNYGTGGGGTFFRLQSFLNGVNSVPQSLANLPTSLIFNPSLLNIVPLQLVTGDYVEFFTDHDAAAAKNTIANTTYAGLLKVS